MKQLDFVRTAVEAAVSFGAPRVSRRKLFLVVGAHLLVIAVGTWALHHFFGAMGVVLYALMLSSGYGDMLIGWRVRRSRSRDNALPRIAWSALSLVIGLALIWLYSR